MEWYEILVSILAGLTAVIPVVIKLVEITTKYVKEKNWSGLLALVMKYMEEAEQLYVDGASKKMYVMMAIENSAEIVRYDVDMEVVSQLIDSLCTMSKRVNFPVQGSENAEVVK